MTSRHQRRRSPWLWELRYTKSVRGRVLGDVDHQSVTQAGRLSKGPSLTEGQSRMPDTTTDMTLRQLVDLVAYLQSRYEVVPPPQMYP